MKLTSEQYKTMCAEFRKTCGYANKLIQATQYAFGSVDNVLAYYPKGLVIFANGERWIHNLDWVHGRFYRVDIRSDEFKKSTEK